MALVAMRGGAPDPEEVITIYLAVARAADDVSMTAIVFPGEVYEAEAVNALRRVRGPVGLDRSEAHAFTRVFGPGTRASAQRKAFPWLRVVSKLPAVIPKLQLTPQVKPRKPS